MRSRLFVRTTRERVRSAVPTTRGGKRRFAILKGTLTQEYRLHTFSESP